MTIASLYVKGTRGRGGRRAKRAGGHRPKVGPTHHAPPRGRTHMRARTRAHHARLRAHAHTLSARTRACVRRLSRAPFRGARTARGLPPPHPATDSLSGPPWARTRLWRSPSTASSQCPHAFPSPEGNSHHARRSRSAAQASRQIRALCARLCSCLLAEARLRAFARML